MTGSELPLHDVGKDTRGRVLVRAGLVIVLLSACTTTSTTSTASTVALQAAPRDCPRGFERAARVAVDQTETAMG